MPSFLFYILFLGSLTNGYGNDHKLVSLPFPLSLRLILLNFLLIISIWRFHKHHKLHWSVTEHFSLLTVSQSIPCVNQWDPKWWNSQARNLIIFKSSVFFSPFSTTSNQQVQLLQSPKYISNPLSSLHHLCHDLTASYQHLLTSLLQWSNNCLYAPSSKYSSHYNWIMSAPC